ERSFTRTGRAGHSTAEVHSRLIAGRIERTQKAPQRTVSCRAKEFSQENVHASSFTTGGVDASHTTSVAASTVRHHRIKAVTRLALFPVSYRALAAANLIEVRAKASRPAEQSATQSEEAPSPPGTPAQDATQSDEPPSRPGTPAQDATQSDEPPSRPGTPAP